ncbi:class I SAM-dependent methyltransferase [Granulicella sibirica]|uniref:S-adenosyl-L-methionine-dependent methyltransferase n=1 Tax=Granulicella sibirica TaxID=2479048 RepID=A0A4Q0SZS4_9BACT|nr:class I SAM-dependent methyltransferase [Granulicella sibirica]RXH55148.1 Transcriptional regulator, MerR family [Granulicella sibirica]
MDEALPSRTAVRVALRRAAHQLVDSPLVFEDPLAVRILGSTYAEDLRRTPDKVRRPFSAALRAFLVARSRYAEEQLASAYAVGVRQYCLLGAGLDTFAYRNPHAGLQVFEVDHPSTQAWKKEMLASSSIEAPSSMRFVPVDFEHQNLTGRLEAATFNFERPCFFAWLGVVPYLTLEAFRSTVSLIASMPPSSGVTFDYALPRTSLPYLEQLAHDSLASRVAQAGEPFQLFFTPEEISAELSTFTHIEDLDTPAISERYFAGRTDGLDLRGSAAHLLTASK